MNQLNRKIALNGEFQILIGICHTLVGLRKYATTLKAMKNDGGFNSVKGDPRRSSALWFFFTGFILLVDGFLVRSLLRQNSNLPAWHGWTMLALSTTGAAILPRSGFWLVIPLALFHLKTARQGQAQTSKLP